VTAKPFFDVTIDFSSILEILVLIMNDRIHRAAMHDSNIFLLCSTVCADFSCSSAKGGTESHLSDLRSVISPWAMALLVHFWILNDCCYALTTSFSKVKDAMALAYVTNLASLRNDRPLGR
jgi:hypothetical protein